ARRSWRAADRLAHSRTASRNHHDRVVALAVPSPRPYGEKVRMRGGGIRKRRRKLPPLTPTLSPQERGEGDEWPCGRVSYKRTIRTCRRHPRRLTHLNERSARGAARHAGVPFRTG